MLELHGIKKDYEIGGGVVHALKGIDLQFRKSEFVAILGPSGCGKTTMLNIIGGLDGYTEGDLVINGTSTREYKDRDWDAYRNHSVGFVFQSYNLIPHQTVLQNVEIALTLSGVSRSERRARAKKALEEVGLGDQLKKRPNEMSGGQMQRVAIARALVNNPDIILADEPTGALDTETSVQVMEILKRISRDRLIVMVTHNPDLAEKYASRTIRMLDGVITSDSQPLTEEEKKELAPPPAAEKKRRKMPSMSFGTSFMLSLKNLITKKGRTILTAFAGSIGIIGIALILAVSQGTTNYINDVQEETLTNYPITIEGETVDMGAMMITMMGNRFGEEGEHDLDKIYSSSVMYEMMDSILNAETNTNNLKAFKEFLEQGGNGISDLANIRYSYEFDFPIYTEDAAGEIIESDLTEIMQQAMSAMYGGDYSSFFSSSMGSMYSSFDVWEELLPGEDGSPVGEQVLEQYDMVYGVWPENYDEVVLFVDSHNEISDMMLCALGLISGEEMNEALSSMAQGDAKETEQMSWTYEELCATKFKLILSAENYRYDPTTGTYVDMSATDAGMDYLFNSEDVGVTLKVVGIARPNEENFGMVGGAIGYISDLTRYAIETTAGMDIVKEQLADDKTDVILGLPFASGVESDELTDSEKQEAITEYLTGLTAAGQAEAYIAVMSQASDEYVAAMVAQQMDGLTREDIETVIIQQYSVEMGVDAATIEGYIRQMSDEELFGQVEQAIALQMREAYASAVEQQMSVMSREQLAGALALAMGDPAMAAQMGVAPLEGWQYSYLYDNFMPPTVSESTFEDNLDLLGYVDMDRPSSISLYATTFADKDEIANLIREYNNSVPEEDKIEYTDYVAMLMSSVTTIIDAITYVLIAFVAISLIVSSIMIGVITLISVQERTKEIGILRAIGASKKDVSGMFNAETVIVGFASGLLGVVVTYLLCIPINAILYALTDIENLKAVLPIGAAVILVIISVILTLIAGIIPSRSAARKDPVVALRTE